MNYGYIDVLNRYVRFVGKPFTRDFASHLDRDHDASFYVQEYLDILFKAQGAVPVRRKRPTWSSPWGNPRSRALSASSTTISSWMHSRVTRHT